MDVAFMALGLLVSELAPVQSRGRVYQQFPAFLTEFLFFVLFKTPQFNHVPDCGLLPLYSFHRKIWPVLVVNLQVPC